MLQSNTDSNLTNPVKMEMALSRGAYPTRLECLLFINKKIKLFPLRGLDQDRRSRCLIYETS